MISPARFIPVAEETRLIIPIGEWVARTALKQFSQWRDAGLTLDHISINTSAAQVFHRGFAACDSYAHGAEAMALVKCPVLFLLGQQDQMTTPKAAQSLVAAARAVQPAGQAVDRKSVV